MGRGGRGGLEIQQNVDTENPDLLKEIKSISHKISKLEEGQERIEETLKKIEKSLKEQSRNTFKTAGSHYQVNI